MTRKQIVDFLLGCNVTGRLSLIKRLLDRGHIEAAGKELQTLANLLDDSPHPGGAHPDAIAQRAYQAAETITKNFDEASRRLKGPRFLFHEVIEEQAQIISQAWSKLREDTDLELREQLRYEVERVAALTDMMHGKLDIVYRFLCGEGSDGDCAGLAIDYGGTGWENDPAVEKILLKIREYHLRFPDLFQIVKNNQPQA